MCNRYRLTAKQAEVAATFGIRPPYEPDETFPVGDVFPTGKKTAFHGAVIVQDGADRKLEQMEWGVPTQVPSRQNPAARLTRYVTNVRNLSSSFWRSWKGVGPAVFFACMSKLAGIINAGKRVGLWYGELSSSDACCNLPTYRGAPAPLYIDVAS